MPKTVIDLVTDMRTGQVTSREVTIPDDMDPRDAMKQILHDCPECRAAMAAGEIPRIGMPDFYHRPARSPIFDRRPRWRTRKR